MVMGSRMQHGSAQPTAAHALQGKRNARVVGCDEDNAQPAAAYALQRYEILLIDPWLTHRYMSYSDSMLNVILLP